MGIFRQTPSRIKAIAVFFLGHIFMEPHCGQAQLKKMKVDKCRLALHHEWLCSI